MSKLAKINRYIYYPVVLLLRIVIGGVFIYAGFSKVADPWGFYYKIMEYLNFLGIHSIWRETVFTVGIILSTAEFTIGVLLLSGCLRKSICWVILVMMIFMLPLTGYLWWADPIEDCGCFGDAIILSNEATFWKNVFITLGTVYLICNNAKVVAVFAPLIQWTVIVASVFYCIILSAIGLNVQPVIDFRPYPVGSQLISDDDTDIDVRLVYQRDGVRREFAIDSIPDSTWTYVERVQPATPASAHAFAIYDGDDEVTADVISDTGPQLLLLIANPKIHKKVRASMANNLNTYIERRGGNMIGIVAISPDSLAEWQRMVQPQYEVFTSDDTSIKELVRGDAGLVYLNDGKIIWKRNLYSLPGDFPDFKSEANQLDDINVVDSGRLLNRLTYAYLSILFVLFALGLFRLIKTKQKEKALATDNHAGNAATVKETVLSTEDD